MNTTFRNRTPSELSPSRPELPAAARAPRERAPLRHALALFAGGVASLFAPVAMGQTKTPSIEATSPGSTSGSTTSSANVAPADTFASPPSGPARVLTLEAALKQALARNPNVAIAEQEIARAEALLRQARASFFPLLTGNGTYTRLDADRVLSAGTDPNTGQPTSRVIASKNQLSANLTLSVPLVAPLGWTASDRARANVALARAGGSDVRRSIAAAVARAYLQIFTHRKQRDTLRRARDTAKAHHAFALTRLQGGVGNALDEARAGQEEATDESQLETAELALARDREALGVLLGSDSAIEASDDVTLPALPSPAEAVADSATRRADVAAVRARLEAAVVARDGMWASYAPLLAAVVQPFYQNPPTLTQPRTGWQAQLILSVPFYDGGLRQGLARERDALVAEGEQALDAALRQASADVRVAFASVTHADRALASARDAAALAEKAASLAQIAYKAGATTNLELIDAERRARDAETQVELAADTAREARLDLLLASGRFPG